MNKCILILATILLAISCIALSEDSDASYSITYGSDQVGAERMVFDSNGGSGGFAQYVLNGNQIAMPTEYKASGASNSSYQGFSKGEDAFRL